MAEYDYNYIAASVTKALRGESDAFAELYAATWQEQYLRLYRLFGEKDRTLSALERLYAQALEHLASLRAPRLFPRWLSALRDNLFPPAAVPAAPLSRRAAVPMPEDGEVEQVLYNVLASCGRPPNLIPVSNLTAWANCTRRRFLVPRVLCALVLLLLLLLPLEYVRPTLSVTRVGGDYSEAVYDVSVRNPLSTVSVSFALDGEPLRCEPLSSSLYRVRIERNGLLSASALSINGQAARADVDVYFIDTDRPELVGSSYDDAYIYIEVMDSYSGVDLDQISCLSSGAPYPFDVALGDDGVCRLTLPRSDLSLDIIVPDLVGNILQLSVS